MKFIIRSSDHGIPFSLVAIEAKKQAVREKLLSGGFQYLEYKAELGLFDSGGLEISEPVTVIEAIAEVSYV